MWSPASAILTKIVTILVSFEAILKRFTVRIIFKSQFQSNDLHLGFKVFTTYKIYPNEKNFVLLLFSGVCVNNFKPKCTKSFKIHQIL